MRGFVAGLLAGLGGGSCRNQLDLYQIKALGIFIGNVGVEEANWLPRIEAVQNCLKSWRHRTLSLKGKTLVLNALALSKIWYVGALVEMPPPGRNCN